MTVVLYYILHESKYNFLVMAGLKITTGHQTMSGKDDYLSGQNLGLAVILTGHVHGSQTINWKKNYLLYSGKYIQLNHKYLSSF